MKKIFLAFMFGMLLMVPTQSHAQFFKQLGKIAEGVGKDIGKAAEQTGKEVWDGITNGPFKVNVAKATCTIANVNCTLHTAARKDGDLLFAATFENELDDDITLEFTNIRVVDTEGNTYTCSITPNASMELISGIAVKATIIAKDVPQNVKNFALVRIGTESKGKAEWRTVSF